MDEARQALAKINAITGDFRRPFSAAVVLANLGESDRALKELEQSFEDRQPGILSLAVDYRFDSLRSRPRFTALLKRMNLNSVPGAIR